MSIRKIPGRLKRNNFFEILPYVIEKNPKLEPIEIFGEDVIKEFPKDIIGDVFDFLAVKEVIRKVKFSIDEYTFRCLYCGAEFIEMGNQYNDLVKSHKKECKCPFFSVIDMNMMYRTSKKDNYIIMTNFLHHSIIKFHLKKRYQYKSHLFRIDFLKEDIKRLRGREPITIELLREFHGEWFKFKKIKNGK